MWTYVCSDESETLFTAFSQETTQSSCPHKHTPTISSKDATLTISLYKDRKVVGDHAYGMSHAAAEAWLAVAQPSSAAGRVYTSRPSMKMLKVRCRLQLSN